VQAAGIWLIIATHSCSWWLTGSVLLGLGTAMVYPALIAVVSDAAAPSWPRVVSVSIASGVTWGMRLEHCLLESSPTLLVYTGQSASWVV
jgi:hypothetical protein